MKKILHLTAAFLTALLLTFTILPAHIQAASVSEAGIDKNKRGSILAEVTWYPAGSHFYLYKIADIVDGPSFGYTDTYKDIAKDINITVNSDSDNSNADLMESAQKLDQLIQERNIKPDYTEAVYTQGNTKYVKFSNLPIGLYLLKGEDYNSDSFSVSSQASLISIPNREKNTDPWKYDITMKVKVEDPNWVSPSPTPSSTPVITDTPVPATPSPVITPPSTPEPGNNVQTGDTFHVSVYAGILLIDAAVLILYFVLRKRNKKEGTHEA